MTSAPSTNLPWDIAVAGTVHLNDITTPHGHQPRLYGGSAVYFALAAARQTTVHLNGVVGSDAEREFRDLLDGLHVDLEGLHVSDKPTYHWHAEHDFDKWVARETPSQPGCDGDWKPTLAESSARAPLLYVGSMAPHFQLEIEHQSGARLIGSDSMTSWIETDLGLVESMAEASDVLFLNRAELAALVGAPVDQWQKSARSLIGRGRLRALVVKAGPDGAALVTADKIVEKPAAPVDHVLDPTGAGDSLAGGFFAACARAKRDDVAFFETALEEGLKCAAAAISRFGTEGLRQAALV